MLVKNLPDFYGSGLIGSRQNRRGHTDFAEANYRYARLFAGIDSGHDRAHISTFDRGGVHGRFLFTGAGIRPRPGMRGVFFRNRTT